MGNTNSTLASVLNAPVAQPALAPQSAPTDAAPQAPNIGDVSSPQSAQTVSNLVQQPPDDLPRFKRTFGNTLKGMLVGLALDGVPGAVVGAATPTGIQRAATGRAQLEQAKITFANAQAAHEVAMAHMADAEYQYMPQRLQQETEQRGFQTLATARNAGYLPVASVALDQGYEQNNQNAATALDQVKQQFGAVPSGMLYVHTGNGITVMKLQNPNAALPVINQVRKAQGLPEIGADTFGALNQADKDQMAKDAINFTNPIDPNGFVTQNSLNIANLRLQTVKAQPDFNGKDALVSQLQATVDRQRAVIDSGARQAAIRAGQSAGLQAQAAQPGQTAAKVAETNALAGPQAAAAGLKAGAEQKARNQADLAAMQGNTDAFGNPIGVTPEGQALQLKEYNSRADKFSKDYVQPLNVLQKTTMEFNRINSNPNQTGAEKVTALLNAVGISGDPLKGKGFRISNDVINEHANSRNIWEGAVQKLNTIAGSGGPITSQQIAHYTAVAQGVVHDAYVTAAQEARRQGLPVNFLPKATTQNQPADPFIAKIYLDAAGGNKVAARKAAAAGGWSF